MTDEEKENYQIEQLPGNLHQAIMALDEDPIVQEALGEHIYRLFREGRLKEWFDYKIEVHDWEVKQYLARF